MSTIEKERLYWLDNAKALAMMMVVLGHVQSDYFFINWIRSIHVPIFLIATGILMTMKGNWGGAKHLLLKLWRPYLTFSIMAVIFITVYDWVESVEFKKNLVVNVYKTLSLYGIYAIWFIPAYFFAVTLIRAVHNNLHLYGQIATFLLLSLMAFVPDLIQYRFHLSSHAYVLVMYPLIAFCRGCVCSVYIFIGKLIGEYRNYQINKKLKNIGIPCSITLLVFSCLMFLHIPTYNLSNLDFSDNVVLGYIVSAFGSIGVLWLFYSIGNTEIKMGTYISKNSLIIMGTHMSLLLTVVSISIVSFLCGVTHEDIMNTLWEGLICVLVIMLLEMPIISLLNGSLKSLLYNKNMVKK